MNQSTSMPQVSFRTKLRSALSNFIVPNLPRIVPWDFSTAWCLWPHFIWYGRSPFTMGQIRGFTYNETDVGENSMDLY